MRCIRHSSGPGFGAAAQPLPHLNCIDCRLSVDVLGQQRKRRLQQDLDVQPQRPGVDVAQVDVDALLHLFQGLGLAPAAIDLGQAGDAGFDPMAGHVGADFPRVVVVVCNRMGAWADQCHVPLQHVEQLRQFIDGSTPDKPAHRRNARIDSEFKAMKIGDTY